MAMRYIERLCETISVVRCDGEAVEISAGILRRAIEGTHDVIDKFRDFDVDVFSILGMRNLSAFIGELYGAAVIKCADGLFAKNPHQDGYPDLLLMDDTGRAHWESLQDQLREKGPFSPFRTGGIEIKSTCGSVPAPAQCSANGFEKPGIGDQRVQCLTGYDWKAHHRETNNLVGIFWDFIEGVPRIVAVFYSSNLNEADWGAIVQPRRGGGRTTSVSIMVRAGVRSMYDGWRFVLRDRRYVAFFDSYNRSDQLRRALKSTG